MTDYKVTRTELTKGITLGEYVELKGLTENNWLLIKDNTGNLITGVRADGLLSSEQSWYVVEVKNYIFPQYITHSERPYYIEVIISKSPVDLIPIVYSETEINENASEPEQPAEDAEELSEENEQEFKVFGMPLSVFQLIQNQVNDYIDKNDIKYGNKDIPCGVRVELMHNIVEASYRCEIYDAFDGLDDEVVKSILNIEPLSPLERTVFEEIENCFERYNEYAELARTAEYGAEYNGESAEEISRYGHLAKEQIFNSDYLKELISKAGLDETYQTWLKVLREREQNKSLEV